MNNGFSKQSILTKWIIFAAIVGLAIIVAVANKNPSQANSDNYPSQPITLVVPFPVGGSTDIAGRILGKHMAESLGQPIVIENRPGAAGVIGIRFVTRAKPDGYTLGVSGVGPSMLLNIIGKRTGYEPLEKLDFIGHMGAFSFLIAGRNELAINNIDELIAYAKKHPNELTYGSSGVGTPGFLFMEALKKIAGIKILHIPYKGSTPLMNDIMGGHVDLGMLAMVGSIDQVKTGAINAIAISGSKRSKTLPDVPTVAESKTLNVTLEADIWNMLVAPKGTPEHIAQMLNNALIDAMKDPEIIAALEKQTFISPILNLPETQAFTEAEFKKWNEMAALSGKKK